MQKILYLEDDINLSDTLSEFLEDNGYDVVSVYDAKSALEIVEQQRFNLLILDVNVPPFNGFELLQNIRSIDILTPVIFTTSLKDMEDVEKGYQSGCDDYIKKPFVFKELLFKINALLKRDNINNKTYLTKDIYFDNNDEILYQNNDILHLKKKELKLLKLFLQNQDKTLDFDQIYSYVWEYDEEISNGSLRTYIRTLRKYLGNHRIVSIKKQGYKFLDESSK
jgi:DNA-binding response OmpR family regulator